MTMMMSLLHIQKKCLFRCKSERNLFVWTLLFSNNRFPSGEKLKPVWGPLFVNPRALFALPKLALIVLSSSLSFFLPLSQFLFLSFSISPSLLLTPSLFLSLFLIPYCFLPPPLSRFLTPSLSFFFSSSLFLSLSFFHPLFLSSSFPLSLLLFPLSFFRSLSQRRLFSQPTIDDSADDQRSFEEVKLGKTELLRDLGDSAGASEVQWSSNSGR